MKLVISAGLVITPQESLKDAVVVAEGGVVSAVGRRGEFELPSDAERFDFPHAVLAPGLVDVHVHGGAGWDVMGIRAGGAKSRTRAASREDMERLLARHGVTSYLATTVTAPVKATLAALERMAESVVSGKNPPFAQKGRAKGGAPSSSRHDEEVRARAIGIHLEGPFISRAKCGVHPVKDLLRPSLARLNEFWKAAGGHIKMMTVAPELPGAEKLIRAAVERGIVVSLGHSDADLPATRRALRAGARHFTHTFNAMRAVSHRDPGIAGAAMTEPGATADIIADGVHVAPEMVDVFLRARGADAAVLISDGISATGMGDGRHRLGPFEVEVRGLRCLHKGRLAGSVLTLDAAARNVMSFGGWPLERAVRLATLNPARVLGIEAQKGVIAPGAAADLTVWSRNGEVLATFARGQGTVYAKAARRGRAR
jgi:N-acetylglucosamine-6-phosphate deacetylase